MCRCFKKGHVTLNTFVSCASGSSLRDRILTEATSGSEVCDVTLVGVGELRWRLPLASLVGAKPRVGTVEGGLNREL